ncbi:MAG: hypothetical protein ACRCTJ_02055 [Brevinema sp.]
MRLFIALIIALFVAPTLTSAQEAVKDATTPRIGVNVVNRFAGQSYFNENFNQIIPVNTTMLELTYGNYRRNFYSALRFTTPMVPEELSYQIKSINSLYSQTSKLGFSIGGGYGLGKVDPQSGRGSSLLITTAMVFDFNIHNKFFEVDNDKFPGFLSWGLEMMVRYNVHFSKYSAFVIGFDVGYSLSTYETSNDFDFFGIIKGKDLGLIHYLTFGGVIGFRF